VQPPLPTEVPVLDPKVVDDMRDTLERLRNTGEWIASTAKTIEARLRKVEQWFMAQNPEVRLNGPSRAGRIDYVALYGKK
jgi:hypothetical protein